MVLDHVFAGTKGARARARASSKVSAHVPALDGIRAVAVTAVLAFHGGLSWATGGFLGVDAFFVFSGYLITALLLAEWARSGGRIRPGWLLGTAGTAAAAGSAPDGHGRRDRCAGAVAARGGEAAAR